MIRMRNRSLATVAILACFAVPSLRGVAHAQMLNDTDISALLGNNGTIGTAAVEIVPRPADKATGFPAQWATLFIANASAGATISCGYSRAVTVNGADSFTIPAGQSVFWPPGTPPKNQPIWCIASASSTPFFAKLGVW
jgi:hypothetical protein